MRFIGAMMNALGSLLPLRGSPQGASASEGPGASPGTTDGATGTETGNFASTLLQLLSQRSPTDGVSHGPTGEGPSGNGEASLPGESTPTAEGQASSVVQEEASTETEATDPAPPAPRAAVGGATQIPLPVPGEPVQEPLPPVLSRDGREAMGPDAGVSGKAGTGTQDSPGVGGGTIPSPNPAGLRPGTPAQAGVAPGSPTLQEVNSPETPRGPDHPSQARALPEARPAVEIQPAPPPSGSTLDAPEVGGVSAAESEKPAAADKYPIDRDPANLDPEFRQRLDRVISRMENEFGHSVQMVEGFRTPQRQKAIYAQGRTQPGPVATWTTDSLHSRGQAADLQVDGSWNNPAGYARLQQVAKEEGLGVLGSKDPGHLELSSARDGGNRSEKAIAWETSSSASRFARPARVARVASTARVARPAAVGGALSSPNLAPQSSQNAGQPAPVSSQGQGSTIPESPKVLDIPLPSIKVELPEKGPIRFVERPTSGRNTGSRAPQNPAFIPKQPGSPGAGTQTSGPGTAIPQGGKEVPPVSRTDDPETRETLKVDTPTQSGRTGNEPGLTNDASRFQGTKPATGVESAQRATTASRIQEILTASETWDTQAAGRLLVDLDDADGAGTRLRLALRGSELAGTLDMADPVLAGRMRQRIGELHQALSKQGLDATGIEARAVSGIEGKGAADGHLAALLKDPLPGLARMMEVRDSAPQNTGGDPRQTREDAQRGFERFKEAPQRDRNKENQR